MGGQNAVGLTLLASECVVCCHSALVDGLVEELRDALRAARDLSGDVIVYAADIEVVGRAGVGVLLAHATQLGMAGRRLRLAAAGGELRQWLDLPSLARVLELALDPPAGWVDPCPWRAVVGVPGQRTSA